MILLIAAIGLLVIGVGTAAYAVSGGGYQPHQQGCQPGDDDYATPDGATYPGCHSQAVNIESGGTTNGDPNDNNTKYVQYGDDQQGIDPNSAATPTEYSLGYPGQSGSPHAGCIAANTDGTNGRPAPASTKPTSESKADNSRYGCGSNPNGLGFETNYNYYAYYCPVAGILGADLAPVTSRTAPVQKQIATKSGDNLFPTVQCEDQSYSGNSEVTDLGNQVDYQPIVQNGVLVYYGMDDNSDNTEHDGEGPFSGNGQKNLGAANGPSDGGAIMFVLSPMKAGDTPSQTNPEGAANLSFGECADGICSEATTEQQTVYQGCGAKDANGHANCDKGTPKNANVYDYAPGGNPGNDPSVNSESPNCNAGDTQTSSEASCGASGMNGLRSATPANENTEPGVQTYSDPDPERSPALPAPLWPTPGLYVGTCGVYAGSPATTGQVLGTKPVVVGGVPVTNQAGQIAIDPNPGTC